MNILAKTTGHFVFLDKNYDTVEYFDYREIPKDFEFTHVTKFLPDIPPPPHTVQQHDEIHMWNKIFKELMEKENASSN